MNWIEKQLAHARPPNSIVHLGAGQCSELETYLLHHPRQIFLIEPNPEVLPELRRRAADEERVAILPVAVSDQEGRRALKLFNYPDLTSLRQPTGLLDLLPGLRQTGQAIIDVIAAQTLSTRLQLEGEEDHWLIIDTPGEELAVIESLANHAQLQQYDRIILKAGAESLYEGARNAEEITAYLQRMGYFEEGPPDNADADWPCLHFRLNPMALEYWRLRRKNEAVHEQKDTLEKQNRELVRQLEHEKGEIQKLAKELETVRQQSEQYETTWQQAQQQAKEFKAQISDLSSRLEKLTIEKTTLERDKEELIKQIQKQEKQLTERSGESKKLSVQLGEAQSKLVAAKSEIEAHRQNTLDLEKQIIRLNEENHRKDKLIDEEFLKAESQIDLIKELVFRDKSL